MPQFSHGTRMAINDVKRYKAISLYIILSRAILLSRLQLEGSNIQSP